MTHLDMNDDAEWVGVDFEFGKPGVSTPRPETPPLPERPPRPPQRPRPRPRPRPPIPPPSPDLDAPERLPSSPSEDGSNAGVVAGAVGGVLGVVLLLLIVYMFVLRRRLNKAKSSGHASSYQLRVEDVAHLSHLDETTNTYVNTTDLQKLVASVRAKEKSSEGRLPTPPRLMHQTPAPYRPPGVPVPDAAQHGDKLVLRAPMPTPHSITPAVTPAVPPQPQPVEEAVYSNLQECSAPPRPATRLGPPKTSPPPPPTAKETKSAGTQPARPAPAPPKSSSPSAQGDAPSPSPTPLKPKAPPQANDTQIPAQRVKPVPPPAALKPGKTAVGGSKPTPPTLPKPGKGKALPPLVMKVRGANGAATPDTACPTPDTATSLLSLDTTPLPGPEGPGGTSISAKIAMLEGQMRTAGGAAPWVGGVRP